MMYRETEIKTPRKGAEPGMPFLIVRAKEQASTRPSIACSETLRRPVLGSTDLPCDKDDKELTL